MNASRNFQDTQVATVFPTASKAGRAESRENVPVDGLGTKLKQDTELVYNFNVFL